VCSSKYPSSSTIHSRTKHNKQYTQVVPPEDKGVWVVLNISKSLL